MDESVGLCTNVWAMCGRNSSVIINILEINPNVSIILLFIFDDKLN